MKRNSTRRFLILARQGRTFVFSALVAFTLTGCGLGVWFQDVVLTSSVKEAKPIPAFNVPVKDPGIHYLQFLAMGDPGTGRAGQRDVAAGMAKKASEDSASFVLVLGDNFYPSGVSSVTDAQWQEKFESVYSAPSLQIPFYAVLGNHDYYLNPHAQVEYTSPHTRWRMPARYYTFTQPLDDSSSVEFFCLDTTPLDSEREEEQEEGQTVESADYHTQITWFEEQLRQSTSRWKIVVGHHALYSGGVHGDNKGMIALLEPLFLKYNVDLYLAGHDHHLEMKKPVKGVNYVVSGGGGTHRSVTWRDDALYAATNMGFNWLRLSARELLVEFLDKDGRLAYASVISKK